MIFAEDLLPSDLAFLEGRVSGVVLAAGSPTAHVCIMLRNMGLPALACAGEEVLQIPAGSDTFIDAAQGNNAGFHFGLYAEGLFFLLY